MLIVRGGKTRPGLTLKYTVYSFTNEKWYPSAPTETKPSFDICVPEGLFVQAAHLFFFFFFVSLRKIKKLLCSGQKRKYLMLLTVNHTRMYLLSQSQMLYLVPLCLFISLEGFNKLKLPSCNKLDKQMCLEPHSKMLEKKRWRNICDT